GDYRSAESRLSETETVSGDTKDSEEPQDSDDRDLEIAGTSTVQSVNYHASIKAAPFEALYGRKCRSPVCWAKKSYADLKRKPMEFEVGDKVMLKVSPWKGVVRFGKLGSRTR
ncbi:hypothetical protein Tco_0148542, partial [Tanacetum coccineum]